MDILTSWCCKNKLTINIKKTKHMCITNKKSPLTHKIQIDQINLANVKGFEYLGIYMDNKLKMSLQIDKIFKTVSVKLHTFSLMRRFLTKKTALLLYKVMIMPHFDYVDFIIDSSTMENTEKLERLHKRAIRKIEYSECYNQKGHYETVLHNFGLTSLYQRRAEHLLTFIYKFKDDIIAIDPQRPKIELRSSNKVKLKVTFTSKVKVQQSPLYRGISLWNQLPPETQLLTTLSEFKNRIRGHIEQGQIKYQTRKLTGK